MSKTAKKPDGKTILINTYWSSKGWKSSPSISDADFQTAKQQGYMFDPPKPISHEEALVRIHNLCVEISPESVAQAFLHSLATRDLAYRSALGSYYYGLAVPKHDLWGGAHNSSDCCYICGYSQWRNEPVLRGYNVLNFERIQWGGVRHTDLNYAIFDLEQFQKLPAPTKSAEGMAILRQILNCIQELQPRDKAGKYRQLITSRKLLKSNKAEVENILDILGICGVLSSEKAKCYCDKFVDEYERAPIEHTNDYEYPINRWRAEDGVNAQRFRIVFDENFEN